MKPALEGTQRSAKSTTATSKAFNEEERGAVRDRVQEMKAGKGEGESAVLAKIAEMREPDRAMAKRLHTIIRESAPGLSPRLWYGMPAYAKDRRACEKSGELRTALQSTTTSVFSGPNNPSLHNARCDSGILSRVGSEFAPMQS